MADTRLQQLAKMNRNPVQETEYQNLLKSSGTAFSTSGVSGQFPGGIARPLTTQEQAAQFSTEQRARGQEFLGRFTSGLSEAQAGISAELGLPGLRQGAFEAGQTARGVADVVRGVPQAQATIAKQVGISAPRLAQRTAAETAKLSPTLDAASRALEESQRAAQFGEEEFGRRLGQVIKPFEIEAGLLGDSVKNEFDLYKTQIGADLDREIARLEETGLNDRAALDRAAKLAEAEKATTSGTFTDLGNRIALINPETGEEITSFNKGLAPSKVSSVDGW